MNGAGFRISLKSFRLYRPSRVLNFCEDLLSMGIADRRGLRFNVNKELNDKDSNWLLLAGWVGELQTWQASASTTKKRFLRNRIFCDFARLDSVKSK